MLSKLKEGDRFLIKNTFGEVTDVVTYITKVFIKTDLGKTFRKTTGVEVNPASSALRFQAEVAPTRTSEVLSLEIGRLQSFELNKVDFNNIPLQHMGEIYELVFRYKK